MSTCKYNDYDTFFKKALESSKNILVITGAGISAESGIPPFTGPGEFWRRHKTISLSTQEAFRAKPELVWEFYHYRRCLAFDARPNKAHIALARLEAECRFDHRKFQVGTINVDGLHQKAGSKNVIELHGALRKVRCTECLTVEENLDDPICESLRNRGDPLADERHLPPINKKDLPKCKHCGELVRPHTIWYDEDLELESLNQARKLVETCDICLLIGVSSLVYPVAVFAPVVADRGRTVAEFNLNKKPFQENFKFHFSGPCTTTLPRALGYNFVY